MPDEDSPDPDFPDWLALLLIILATALAGLALRFILF